MTIDTIEESAPASDARAAAINPRLIGITEEEKMHNLAKVITLTITILPFLGLLAGFKLAWGGISALDIGLLVGLYSISILGVTIGFHRQLTHGGFETPTAIKIILAVMGSLAVEGSVIRWVADHRRHHMFTDKEGDPHSPHLVEEDGIKGIVKGLWHAHIGWFFVEETTVVPRFAPDLLKDRGIKIVSDLFPLWAILSFAIAPGIALAVTHSFHAAITAFVWGSLVRIFLMHHVTWSVNSICHYFGKRPYETGDKSTNNWLMSIVSFGEGWHNNHHAFPSSAFHGLEWWQIDISGLAIRAMRKVGLVRNVRVPTERQLARKAAIADEGAD